MAARGSGCAIWLVLVALTSVLSGGVSFAHAGGPVGCTIVGSAGADHLKGTPRADTICGLGGADTIKGLGGDDRLIGGAGDDLLIGGKGDDVLLGGPGDDHLIGGPGKDRLFGGLGKDTLSGGVGSNSCPATDRADVVRHCRRKKRPGRSPRPLPGLGSCRPIRVFCGSDAIVENEKAPDLRGVGFSLNSADLAAGAVDVGVHVEATHDSPLLAVRVELRGPGGFEREAVLEATNKFEFEFKGSTTFSAASQTGTYWIDRVILTDAAGRTTDLDDAALDAGGFGHSGRELELYEGPDTTPPKVVSIDVSPVAVNTDGGPATVTMTIHATDDLSGVESIGGAFDMPNTSLGYGFAMGRPRGTAPDGEWVLEVNLPRYAAPGHWELDNLHIHDFAGNSVHYYDHTELEAAGLARGFDVTGTGDTTPPQILDLSFSPTVLHTARGESQIFFQVHLSDDLSGISLENSGLSLVVQSQSEPSFTREVISPGLQVSGNELDGWLELGENLPADAPLGVYEVTSILARDRAFNTTELSGASLQGKGWDLTFENLP